MFTYSFEKLEAWQLAKKLVVVIYKLTDHFPDGERFGMISQMRRAAVSVCSNLAEGSGRKTAKDQASFYNISYSSLMELLNQLLISEELCWVKAEEIAQLRANIEFISWKINALRNSILK